MIEPNQVELVDGRFDGQIHTCPHDLITACPDEALPCISILDEDRIYHHYIIHYQQHDRAVYQGWSKPEDML